MVDEVICGKKLQRKDNYLHLYTKRKQCYKSTATAKLVMETKSSPVSYKLYLNVPYLDIHVGL